MRTYYFYYCESRQAYSPLFVPKMESICQISVKGVPKASSHSTKERTIMSVPFLLVLFFF